MRSPSRPPLFGGIKLLSALGALLFAASFAGRPSQAEHGSLPEIPFRVAFTASTFSNVNPADAEAAFMVFTKEVGRKRGYDLDTRTKIYDDLAEIETDVRSGRVTLLIVSAWEYLNLNVDTEMEPAFIHVEQGKSLKELLLLARREDSFSTISDLRGRSIAILAEPNGDLVAAWLDCLLLRSGNGAPSLFFSRVERATKPSAAVLPVFFGKTDACIVDRPAFDTMVEMNPQLGRQLVSLAVSEPLLDSITLIARSGFATEGRRQDTFASLAELHLEPSGRQILTLFRIDRLAPFKEEHLDGVRRLRAERARPGGKNRS